MSDTKEFLERELKRIGNDVNAGFEARKAKEIELNARLLEIEQKAARRGGDPGAGTPDVGALRNLLETSTELKAVAEGKARRCVLDLPEGFFQTKQITSTGVVFPEQMPGIVAPVNRRLTVRNLIPSIPVTSGAVIYTQETGFDNQAATVSETLTKPESNITFVQKTANIVVLAHWVKTSLQALADVSLLMQYIDNRLRYGLAFVEEQQLLKGSGVGNNLNGLLTSATAYTGAVGGDTKIDTLRRAMAQLENTEFSGTGIILNPSDWMAIALTKSTQGEYIVGEPGGANPATLWNLPVVSSNSMTVNNFLVGDFPQAALIFDRLQARVDISTETNDAFIRNEAYCRAEERLGLAILRPGGLIKGTFA